MPAYRWLGGAIPLLAVSVIALATACDFGNGNDDPQPNATEAATGTPVAATPPEEALRRYVQNRFQQGFVENCDDASRPGDVGKRCARLRGERDAMLAYELGPTFAEYVQLVILRRAGDDWTLVHLENRNPNEPPVPGIPWPLEVNTTVVVAGTAPDCLRIRERPGTLAPELACLDDGTVVTIGEGPVDIDGREWWRLEGYGWSASNWLRYPEDVPEVATVTPEA